MSAITHTKNNLNFFLLSLIHIIPHKSLLHRKIIIRILKPKYKTLAVTYMVGAGYLWMHRNINLISAVPIPITYADHRISVPIFFPLLQQYSLNTTFLSFSCMSLIMSHYPNRRTKWLYFYVNLQNVYLVIDTRMKIMYEHINRK